MFNCRLTVPWRQLFNQLLNRVTLLYTCSPTSYIFTRYLARCVINIYIDISISIYIYNVLVLYILLWLAFCRQQNKHYIVQGNMFSTVHMTLNISYLILYIIFLLWLKQYIYRQCYWCVSLLYHDGWGWINIFPSGINKVPIVLWHLIFI